MPFGAARDGWSRPRLGLVDDVRLRSSSLSRSSVERLQALRLELSPDRLRIVACATPPHPASGDGAGGGQPRWTAVRSELLRRSAARLGKAGFSVLNATGHGSQQPIYRAGIATPTDQTAIRAHDSDTTDDVAQHAISLAKLEVLFTDVTSTTTASSSAASSASAEEPPCAQVAVVPLHADAARAAGRRPRRVRSRRYRSVSPKQRPPERATLRQLTRPSPSKEQAQPWVPPGAGIGSCHRVMRVPAS